MLGVWAQCVRLNSRAGLAWRWRAGRMPGVPVSPGWPAAPTPRSPCPALTACRSARPLRWHRGRAAQLPGGAGGGWARAGGGGARGGGRRRRGQRGCRRNSMTPRTLPRKHGREMKSGIALQRSPVPTTRCRRPGSGCCQRRQRRRGALHCIAAIHPPPTHAALPTPTSLAPFSVRLVPRPRSLYGALQACLWSLTPQKEARAGWGGRGVQGYQGAGK